MFTHNVNPHKGTIQPEFQQTYIQALSKPKESLNKIPIKDKFKRKVLPKENKFAIVSNNFIFVNLFQQYLDMMPKKNIDQTLPLSSQKQPRSLSSQKQQQQTLKQKKALKKQKVQNQSPTLLTPPEEIYQNKTNSLNSQYDQELERQQNNQFMSSEVAQQQVINYEQPQNQDLQQTHEIINYKQTKPAKQETESIQSEQQVEINEIDIDKNKNELYAKKLEKQFVSEKKKKVEQLLKESQEIDQIKSNMGTAHFGQQFLEVNERQNQKCQEVGNLYLSLRRKQRSERAVTPKVTEIRASFKTKEEKLIQQKQLLSMSFSIQPEELEKNQEQEKLNQLSEIEVNPKYYLNFDRQWLNRIPSAGRKCNKNKRMNTSMESFDFSQPDLKKKKF